MRHELKRIQNFRLLEWYPPFLWLGLRIRNLTDQPLSCELTLPLKIWNRNFHGSLFGGAICAASDPFPALLLMRSLKGQADPWTKSNEVVFLRPAVSTLKSHPTVTPEELRVITDTLERRGKVQHEFTYSWFDHSHQEIARVRNTVILIRRKSTN